MEGKEKNKGLFGLVGKNISYSFSRTYFSKKFKRENIQDVEYVNFDIESIESILDVFKTINLKGLNVTIPYKESIIPFLDDLNNEAKYIGAVNTIQFKENKKIGYNTDAIGFQKSLKPLLKKHHTKALIFGTGGASKAVAYVLDNLQINFLQVSRNPSKTQISYNQLTSEVIKEHTVIINCTPLGTHPKTNHCPNIPYQFITSSHILYDLINNPSETIFLSKGKEKGALIKNGLEMLELQAEASWKIWK